MIDRTTQEVGTADQERTTPSAETAKPKRAKQPPKPKKAKLPDKPSEKDVKALELRAEKIREHDQSIRKAQQSSMAMALAAGESLLWGKQELKRLGIKKKFQAWIETDCKIEYKSAYNYMKVLQASLKDPSIKELGLTEAYLKLRLVTRKTKTVNGDGHTESSDTGAAQSGADPAGKTQNAAGGAPSAATGPTITATTATAQRRRLGALEVERRDTVYVLEIDPKTAWRDSVFDALSDEENLPGILADGLLLKLKE